ncbi:alpha/beta fold hydrolase [Cellulomonas wangsupingiae]|uniref:alpha/beta fold hydrolase n=1 Tax=Cellulomonas wangsupingiae TaxID=2968085 RepID=UPI001D0EBC37|nr:alpha/beta fold hydrolase [Cellulomonas wangsupingiae]MCM0638607.1 alpha/beta hydrolase [Cellulomonas wangsupingiae]
MTLLVRERPAPTGMHVQVDRLRIGGLALRVSTVRDAAAHDRPERDHRDFVLVHGLGSSSATFGRLARRLASAGTVHLLDLPGFARVPRPREGLGMEDLARLVTRWVEHAGVQGATFLGHSMGAQVVTEVLAASPGIGSHLVLVGPTVEERARTATRQMLHLTRSTAFESHRLRALLLRAYVECGPRWFVRELRHMMRHPLEDRLRQVDVPVLLVRGEHDRVAPNPWAELLAAAAPRGRAVTVAGAAHAAMYDHGREVGDLVLEHVAR